MFITTRISLRGVRGGNVAGKVVRHGNVARSIAGRTADPSDYTRRNLNFTYIQTNCTNQHVSFVYRTRGALTIKFRSKPTYFVT